MLFKIEDTETIGDYPDIMLSFLKNKEISDANNEFGQIYVNFISPGKTKGNHYHKKRHEWISCIVGRISVSVKDLVAKNKDEAILDSKDRPLKRIHIPPSVIHTVKNVGKGIAIVVEYSSEQHNPEENDFFKIGGR